MKKQSGIFNLLSKTKKGLFIVIEGIDGAGTTTQCDLLFRNLAERNINSKITFEPTDGPIGSMIRMIMSHRLVIPNDSAGNIRGYDPIDQDTISLLFAADRMDHCNSMIIPNLDDGITVISDRYYHSTLAYQSLNCDMDWLRAINSHSQKPDLVFFIDIKPTTAMSRISAQQRDTDMYEKSNILEKVNNNYRDIMNNLKKENKERIIVLDGSQSVRKISGEIFSETLKFMGEQ